jgi:hypothetical protein
MHRLYVVLPDQQVCKVLVLELQRQGVPEHHLHVVARLDQSLEGLPEAGVWQKTELAHGIEWGVGLGGVAGLIGGLLAVTFPPAGLVLGGGAVLAGSVAGAGVGGVITAMLASHEHNHVLDHFQREISRGKLLLMVDMAHGEIGRVRALIEKQHPQAEIGVLHARA